nr:MAG TPA: hypothetical protein [Caudoviricetes sp.]
MANESCKNCRIACGFIYRVLYLSVSLYITVAIIKLITNM